MIGRAGACAGVDAEERVATTFDVTFFKIAVYNKITDQPTADRCMAFIDEQGQSGRAVRASEVLLSMRIANPQIVERLTQMTEAALGHQANTNGQASSGLRSATLENAGAAHRASAHTPVSPPTASPGPAPSSRQQTLPPSGRQQTLPPSSRQQALPPSGRQQALPPSSRQQALPPSSRQQALPPSSRQQALPPSGRQQALPPSGRQQVLSTRASSRRLSRVATPLTPPPSIPWEAMEPGEIEFGPRIAEGPIGPVYSGKNRRSGVPLAIKILSPRFTKYPMVVQAIVSDLQKVLQAQMTCGFCAGPRLVVEKDNYWVMAFDFVRGRTLEDLAREWGPTPAERVIRIGLQLAQALAFSHARGVSHGDVRPANIFIDGPTAGFRLIDYGLARASALARGYARFGVPFGHPQYLAPEVIPVGITEPTPAQDLYALGILLYELAVGRRPFDGDDIQQILVSQLKLPLPPPPAGVLPRPLAELIQSLTAKDPERRLSSADEAVKKLHLLSQVDLAEVSDAEAPPDWLQTADDLAPIAGQWSEEKITKAKSLEPHEWDPDEVEDDPDFIAQNTPAAVEVAPATSAASSRRSVEGAGYTGALAEAQAAVEDGRPDPSPAAQGDAGLRFELQADSNNAKRGRYARTASILIACAAFTYLALAFGIGHFSAEETRKARTLREPVAPLIPAVDNSEARVSAEKELASKRGKILAQLQEDLAALRGQKDWPAALSRIDSAFNGTKTDRASDQALSEIRAGVVADARSDLKTNRDRSRALAESGKLAEARQAIVRLDKRIIPETRQSYQIAIKAVATDERRAARAKAAAPAEKLAPWQTKLAAFFRGELRFQKRDILGLYRFAKREELDDFDHGFEGARFGGEQDPGVELLAGAEQRKRLIFPVPIEDLLKLEIEYEILGAPRDDAVLAFLIGIEETRRTIGNRLAMPLCPPAKPKEPAPLKALVRLERLTGKDPQVRFESKVEPALARLWKTPREDKKPRTISLRKVGPRLLLSIDGKRVFREQFDQARGLFGLEIQGIGIKLRRLSFRAFALPDEAQAWIARQARDEGQ